MTAGSSINAIFVYGTLRRGQLRQFHWPETPSRIDTGFIKAALYDLGPYPAITAGDDIVIGEVWLFPQNLIPKTLEVLDKIEGYIAGRSNNLYERIIVAVNLSPSFDEPPVHAFAYMMDARKLPPKAVRLPPRQIPEIEIPVCRWPPGDEAPNVTSMRPDPYPDDIA